MSSNWHATQFFVDQARSNSRSFAQPQALDKALIYNYQPVHGLSTNFEQIYFFPASQ